MGPRSLGGKGGVMGKYTPGPWWVDKNMAETDYLICCGMDDRNRGYVASLATTNDDALSNARLVSAAPDLLEALKAMLPMVENLSTTPVHKKPFWPWGSHRMGSIHVACDSWTLNQARAAIRKAEGES